MVETYIVPVLISLIILALFITYVVNGASRIERLKKIASEQNLEFSEVSSDLLIAPFISKTLLFSRGKKRFIRNLMQGKINNFPIKIFDYEYWQTINAKGRKSQTILWVVVESKGSLHFNIRSKNWIDNLNAANHASSNYIFNGDGLGESVFDQNTKMFLEKYRDVNVECYDCDLFVYIAPRSLEDDNLLPPQKEDFQTLISIGLFMAKRIQVVSLSEI